MRLFGLILFFLTNALFAQNVVDKKGMRQGKWIKYYDNSTSIQFEGEFLDDRPIGIFTYYKKDGSVSAKMQHLSKISARIQFYHSNGAVMSDGFYLNEKKDSTWYNYTKNGVLSSIETFKNDLLEGPSVTFYISEFYENPIVMRRSFFRNGVIHGDFIEYFPSGKIKFQGKYVNAEPVGTWKEFDNNGKLKKDYKYKNGEIHGWLLYYNDKGEVISKSLFKQGELLLGSKKEEYLKYCKEMNINPDH